MTDRKKHLKMKQLKCFCPTYACTTPLIPFLTQPPHECTLTGWGSRVYPNGGGSRVRPGQGRRCAWASPLAARTARLQLRLCPCGSRCALAARASPSRLMLRARSLGFALAACSAHSRLALRARSAARSRLANKQITPCMNSYYTICIKIV